MDKGNLQKKRKQINIRQIDQNEGYSEAVFRPTFPFNKCTVCGYEIETAQIEPILQFC
jgi:hypothetical protein